MMITNVYHFIDSILGNPRFLCFITFLTVVTKLYIVWYLLKSGPKNSTFKPWCLLLILLATTIITEATWIPKLIQEINPTFLDYTVVLFLIRLAWIFYVVQAQALALFLESLLERKFLVTKLRIPSFVMSGCLALYFFYIAIADFHIIDKYERMARHEYFMFSITFSYMLVLFGYSSLKALKRMRSNALPRILLQQIRIFLQYMLFPYIFMEFIGVNPLFTRSVLMKSGDLFSVNYTLVTISLLFSSYTLYFAAKRMLCLRFLNMKPHVQTNKRFDFINDFKNVLEQLGRITDTKELRHVTTTFFKEAFLVNPEYLTFSIRPDNKYPHQKSSYQPGQADTIEQFLDYHGNIECSIYQFIRAHKVLIYDEIEFSYFYNLDEASEEIIKFMKGINADVLLPIFEKQHIIGYIVIERHVRGEFYSNSERDEMLVYASYLSNIIILLNHKNLQAILQQEKELKEELYNKHQEITLYKESIRSFLRTSKERKIGIVFYKNTKLKLGNHAAQELTNMTLAGNNNEGHPTKKVLRQIGRFVEEYKQPQSATITDAKGEQLICTGFLNIDGTHVIILIHYPEISDIVKKQVDLLKDPTKWDYLLYLETTKSGQLINRLLPSSSESLLNFKIDLMRTALTAKAVLLDLPEKDLDATVSIIHNISLRQKFDSLILASPEKHDEVAIALFGINPIFGMKANPALLEILNAGTLFIKNIHYLSLETQRNLTNVIKYGFFTICKGTTRMFSDVRIVCSTDQNLENLMNDGFFYEPLYHELVKNSLSMPSLLTLPEHELTDLTTALSEQAIQDQPLKNLYALSQSEKNKLAHNRLLSLHELKTKIHHMLDKKSNKNPGQEFTVEASYYAADPELEDVRALGKQALKDPKIMKLLSQKFNQAEIAKFLGVNRSSVSRRLRTMKEYGAQKL